MRSRHGSATMETRLQLCSALPPAAAQIPLQLPGRKQLRAAQQQAVPKQASARQLWLTVDGAAAHPTAARTDKQQRHTSVTLLCQQQTGVQLLPQRQRGGSSMAMQCPDQQPALRRHWRRLHCRQLVLGNKPARIEQPQLVPKKQWTCHILANLELQSQVPPHSLSQLQPRTARQEVLALS